MAVNIKQTKDDGPEVNYNEEYKKIIERNKSMIAYI